MQGGRAKAKQKMREGRAKKCKMAERKLNKGCKANEQKNVRKESPPQKKRLARGVRLALTLTSALTRIPKGPRPAVRAYPSCNEAIRLRIVQALRAWR